MFGGLLLLFPCLPPYPGSLLLNCESIQNLQGWIIRIVLSLIGFGAALNLVGTGVFSGAYGVFLKLLSLQTHLIKLTKGFKSAHNSKIREVVMKYNQFQLICLHLNDCYQWSIFTFLLSGVQLVDIVVFYSLIKLFGKIPHMVLVTIMIFTADASLFSGLVY